MFPRSAPNPVNQGWWRLFVLCVLSTAAAATIVFTPGHPLTFDTESSLDKWAAAEAKVAWNQILANIGPAAGAADGVVIASPSTGEHNEPDYFVSHSHSPADRSSTPGPETRL